MNIVAIIACRNEEVRLGNCLSTLQENGIKFAIIDDGSTDATAEVVHRPAFRRSLVHYERRASDNVFRLEPLLMRKAELARQIDADWIIHHDADEVMQSYRPGETLAESIERVGTSDIDIINLDEFVLLPLDHAYVQDNPGPQPLLHYYFFEPAPTRLMRIWKPRFGSAVVRTGGHQVLDGSPRLAAETFALRHYIFRDQAHAFSKYESRTFDPDALKRGWHFNRVNQQREKFRFPDAAALKRLPSPDSREFDRSEPKLAHYWQW